MTKFHNALGQYIVCQNLVQLTELEHQLFLAIDDITYSNSFQRLSIQMIIQKNRLHLLIVNIEQEQIGTMDSLAHYRQSIQSILKHYYCLGQQNPNHHQEASDIAEHLILDLARQRSVILPEDIVLGFHHPSKRPLTEFAVGV